MYSIGIGVIKVFGAFCVAKLVYDGNATDLFYILTGVFMGMSIEYVIYKMKSQSKGKV